MSTRQPPRLAALLIKHVAANEPLLGDLHEEYQAGRSDAWYWQQAWSAVCAQLRRTDLREVFAAKSRLMQCVMIGLISVCVVFSVKLTAVVVLDEAVLNMVIGPYGLRELTRLALSFALSLPAGLAIAKLHEHSRAGAVLAFATVVPAWAFANVYLLDGRGDLNAMLPHAVALVVFILGLLMGGMHLQLLIRRALAHPRRV
jgi:hypothetical protein